MAQLALIRHGESEWNALGMWTGKTDIGLTEKGQKQAEVSGETVKDIHFDYGFESSLKRAAQTMEEIKKGSGEEFPVESDPALDERDYGNFTGMKKDEVEKEYGEALFDQWHRGWDYPLPHGETLKNVYERVVPYYLEKILPLLKQGKNVVVSAHGNSLRALVKFLENIADDKIHDLEIAFGDVHLYSIDVDGKVTGKEIRKIAV